MNASVPANLDQYVPRFSMPESVGMTIKTSTVLDIWIDSVNYGYEKQRTIGPTDMREILIDER